MLTRSKPIKQCVILSGKGGTGKTSICAGLIDISSKHVEGVYVDADVDAANLALVMDAVQQEIHRFTGSKLAFIEPEKCINCGFCYDVCRYHAIKEPTDDQPTHQVIDLLCDGCGACVYGCPTTAIHMEVQEEGEWYYSTSSFGDLFHAELFPAAENTGKLVTMVKQNAKLFAEEHQKSLMLVDGPPGIGCPVISASAGANLALVVTEPSVAGIHDLNRILQTLKHFDIPTLICINKSDLYPEGTAQIKALAQSENLEVCGEIPFDDDIPKAMIAAQPITQYSPNSASSRTIEQIWNVIYDKLFDQDGKV